MSMQAVVQHRPGGIETLSLEVVERPMPGPGQLLVRVLAAGVNRADVVQREGHYPPPAGVTPLLGLEVAGIVEAVGSAGRFQPGDAVFGLVPGGGYAEYAVLEADLAIPKPDWLGWAEAASLPEVWMTAWLNMVEVARLAEGESLLVHAGASGVGAATIQLGRLLGARVFASASSAPKQTFCRELGAERVFKARDGGFAPLMKEAGGVDVILDPVGGAYLADNIASLRQDGRLILIGVMGGSHAGLNLGPVLVKRLSVRGSTLRSQPVEVKARLARALERTILPALHDGAVRLTVDTTFPFAQVGAAHTHMEADRNLGKIVLTMPAVTTLS
ncbi:putative NAD(P)H quinone oxidoreductase, PIG3 family [Gulbenkiania indica]|uniref:Putative NAD(P)H quinone oxidoreductase, PIG3 family n=1 Tax=Gulbenkiania indica TaxID=375574 RepID=A0A0K6H1N2_9NEIS|nr:NAD(P)H-quinone oxidoreductase [Gulbenkiania indica]CUA84731.1 putative NAD(P)H quinone oxidoreductase, PIG3 family [Gulbenkiania indica]